MRRPRIIVRSLLALVAVGFIDWLATTPTLDDIVFGSAMLALGSVLLLLMGSVLLAIHRVGSSGAYWLGFALFGWAYFLSSQIPSVDARLPTSRGLAFFGLSQIPSVDARLPTSNIRIRSSFPHGSGPGGGPLRWKVPFPGGGGPRNGFVILAISPTGFWTKDSSVAGPDWFQGWSTSPIKRRPASTPESLLLISHSLLALTLAFLGAASSRSLHRQGHRGNVSTAEPGTPLIDRSPGDPG